MATGKSGFDDVSFDLISLQRCHEFLRDLPGSSGPGPALT